MKKLLLILLFPILAIATPYTACYTWVSVSAYGTSATVENYVYECFIPLSCNDYETLQILKSDSSTVISNYHVVDWDDDTLHTFIKIPTVTANTRDSVCVIRKLGGTAPSVANTFIAGFDGSINVDAIEPITTSNATSITRWSFDSTRYLPMLTATGDIDGYRECSTILKLPVDNEYIWVTSAYTGTYDSDSAYSLLYHEDTLTAQWDLFNEIGVYESGVRLYSEDAFLVLFSNNDSLAMFFEDKARGGDSDQVSVVTSALADGWSGIKWSAKTVCVGPSANGGNNVQDFVWPSGGGRRSPSSPTVYNDGDSAFYCFCEIKANRYSLGGIEWELGVGATYLYKATSLRGPYVRQPNKSANYAGGDTLVPIYPLETQNPSNIFDYGGIPHGIVKYGDTYILCISGVDSTGPSSFPQYPLILTSSRLDSGWTKVIGLSSVAASDSIWDGAITLPQQLAEVGPYMMRESSDLQNIYLKRGLVFDTVGHGLTGWQWHRPPIEYLGLGSTDNGLVTLAGEQTVETSVGLRMQTGTTALGDSFEVIYKLKIPDRSGGFSAVVSIGSGAVTDYLDNGTEWNRPVQESGTSLIVGENTSTLARHGATGTQTTFQNNDIVSPSSYNDWTQFRLQNRVSEGRNTDHTWTTHRWTFDWNNLGRFNFRKNANGTAGEFAGNANKILVSGGTVSGAAGILEIPQFDYLFVRPFYDYELFAAPGIVARDSFPITNSAYIYQNATTFNYGAADPLFCGWPNGGGSTRANALFQKDISSLPDSAQILYAELFVWDTVRTNPLDSVAFLTAYRITSDWVESTGNGAYVFGGVSWNNQGNGTGVGGTTITQADSVWTTAGGDFDPVHSEMIKLNSTSDPAQYAGMHFDITDFAKYWHENPTQNFGVMIREARGAAPAKTINQRFQTEGYGMTTHRPSIIIYWTEPTVNQFTLDDGIGGDSGWSLWNLWNLWGKW